MTLYDLIFKAGGFLDEEFKKRTYLKRAELVRVLEDSDEKEIIPFDLGKALDKKGMSNLELKIDDSVEIYSLSDMIGDADLFLLKDMWNGQGLMNYMKIT